MTSESWFAIDSDDSPLRNRKITTVVLARRPVEFAAFLLLDPNPDQVVADVVALCRAMEIHLARQNSWVICRVKEIE